MTETLTKEPLTPEAEKLLNIILHPRNNSFLPAEQRLEFMKQQFLKPENAKLAGREPATIAETVGGCLDEFDAKNYVPVRPAFNGTISYETSILFLHTLSNLCRLGVVIGHPDSELDRPLDNSQDLVMVNLV